MLQFKSKLLITLSERGFIKQITNPKELDKRALNGPITAYIGFDLTADSLHVGHLIMIMLLRIIQKTGHKAILLIGGGTSLIGDPSFKTTKRKMLSNENISNNLIQIKSIFSKYFKFNTVINKSKIILVNNADWLCKLNYMNFLRDYGIHFSINRMISYENIKERLSKQQNLSFLEFNYMILQSYDFLELYKRYNCELQIGGSDQWGNIINGIDLIRRVVGKEVIGLTTPLLITSSGRKMGKSENGAIWLNEKKLSVYDFWQYWRNIEDDDVGHYLRIFTELSILKIKEIEKIKGIKLNKIKIFLATEITKFVHSKNDAIKAAEKAYNIFEEKKINNNSSIIKLSKKKLKLGIGLLSVLVMVGFATSNNKARHYIKEGIIKINNKQINSISYKLTLNNVNNNNFINISAGKKSCVIIECIL